MDTQLSPYLQFPGTARAAMDFYQSIFGGNLTRSTFSEYGIEGNPENIMHSALRGGGLDLMASDLPDGVPFAEGGNVVLSLSGDDRDQLFGFWNALAEDGDVAEPIADAPWGDVFGMLTDRFGVQWMINITDGSQA